MAVSTEAGHYGFVTQMTVILKEGNITVNSSAYGPFGKTTVCTLASEISKGDPVALSTDTANTFDACGGNFVVAPVSNGVDLAMGVIIDYPKWVVQPTTSQSTWSSMLSAGYYRIATIELFIPMSVFKATLVCTNTTAITPGTTGNLDIDASASQAAHAISVADVGSGGATTMIPLTYAAQGSSVSYSILIGFTGFVTVVT